jgi:glycosyltransferase involved in cell wall biosynthesis
VLNPTLTIVLPVHNGEARLRGCVGEILELASELTPDFGLLIIDDGSTDDTYAAAEELSARFPQIRVRRQRQQRGLGPTLEAVRRQVRSDVVLVHDGVSPIDPNQVRSLWREHIARPVGGCPGPAAGLRADVRELTEVATTHTALAEAHQRVLGFQLLSPSLRDADWPAQLSDDYPVRTDAGQTRVRAGVGTIPTLPRPKFLTALAEFTLGE